jgi:hypothetical protein
LEFSQQKKLFHNQNIKKIGIMENKKIIEVLKGMFEERQPYEVIYKAVCKMEREVLE